MAVVPRKRKGRVVYGVSTSWRGNKYWELVGPNRREAEQRDNLRLREIANGTFRPGEFTDASSVLAYAEAWLELRTNRSADNDRHLLRRHFLTKSWFVKMPLSDVRPKHVGALIKELSAGTISPKTVSLIMGLVRVMFRDAVIEDVISATPYVVARGTLKRAGERRTPYEAHEARALLGPNVGERERIWNTIALYTGCRCGEVCGLRWSDWDETPAPLGCIAVSRQYDGQVLKTERARLVPVHPELAAALAAWRDRWSFFFLRRPEPGDLIVPSLDGTAAMTASSAYKAWLRSCKAAGVTNRSMHSTRHTFITMARRGGADPRVVELITHNPKGTIVDVYTTLEWAEYCRAVLCLTFDAPFDAESRAGMISAGGVWSGATENIDKPGAIGENAEVWAVLGQPFSSGSADLDARVDARRTVTLPALEALALAAESALRGRVFVGGVKVSGGARRRKGARRA